jgi:hypothetical protein
MVLRCNFADINCSIAQLVERPTVNTQSGGLRFKPAWSSSFCLFVIRCGLLGPKRCQPRLNVSSALQLLKFQRSRVQSDSDHRSLDSPLDARLLLKATLNGTPSLMFVAPHSAEEVCRRIGRDSGRPLQREDSKSFSPCPSIASIRFPGRTPASELLVGI